MTPTSPANLPPGGLYVPPEMLHAIVSAVILMVLLVVAVALGYYLFRGVVAVVKKLLARLRMSKVERAHAYLLKHDPDYRQREQVRTIMRTSQQARGRVAIFQRPAQRKVSQQ